MTIYRKIPKYKHIIRLKLLYDFIKVVACKFN